MTNKTVFTLGKRLTLLVAAPVLLILFLTADVLRREWSLRGENKELVDLAHLAVESSAVVHRLQIERGATAGYVGGGGQDFAQRLTTARGESDEAHRALLSAFPPDDDTRLPGAVASLLQTVRADLRDLKRVRGAADALNAESTESIGFYTARIDTLLSLITELGRSTTQAALLQKILQYEQLLRAKEAAGQERAVLSGTFAAGAFGQDAYAKFLGLVAAQEIGLSGYRHYATAEELSALEQTESDNETREALKLRALAMANDPTRLAATDGTVWFDLATRRIDGLKKVEDLTAANLIGLAEEGVLGATRRLQIWGGGLSVLVLGICGLALRQNRTIFRLLDGSAAELEGHVTSVAAAASQVSATSQNLASGASEQASSLEETSASLEEMTSMTRSNADHATNADKLSSRTRSAAETGAGEMKQMLQAMEAIQKSGDNISKIIKTIDEIAFQTNILALNAAVEAARAGDAGMGFAVVADEVRSLAQRSAAAAKETSERIEESIQRSTTGGEICGRVARQLDEILGNAREMDALVAQISESGQQQSEGIRQINDAVTQMEQVTQSNAASAEEGAAAAEELHAQSQSLQSVTAALRQLVGGTSTSTNSKTANEPGSPRKVPGAPDPRPAPAQSGREVSRPAHPDGAFQPPSRDRQADSHFTDF